MEKINTIVKLSHKFALKFFLQYLKMLLKPFLIMLFGFIFLPLGFHNPIFAFLALIITIPCFCYAFWQGFCITYLLNFAALNFLKNGSDLRLEDYKPSLKACEKEFAFYISFCAIMVIICYIPTFYVISKNISSFNINNPMAIISGALGLFFIIFINTAVLAPFANFFTQAYFFKKEDENFFKLFLNCYKKLDKTGLLIAYGIMILTLIVSTLNVLSIPLLIILNLYFYSINTFWYYSRVNNPQVKLLN